MPTLLFTKLAQRLIGNPIGNRQQVNRALNLQHPALAARWLHAPASAEGRAVIVARMDAAPISFGLQVDALRPYLLRYAQLQLRDPYRAEDVVSETIVAALSNPDNYAGKAELKTYMVGILKFKILDQFRANKHLVYLDDALLETQDHALHEEVFAPDGHFSSAQERWPDPSETLQSKQFFQMLEACVDNLPPQLSRIFMMREWLELSSTEICKQVGISATNLHVSLHRARMRLRACLELRWFGNHTPEAP